MIRNFASLELKLIQQHLPHYCQTSVEKAIEIIFVVKTNLESNSTEGTGDKFTPKFEEIIKLYVFSSSNFLHETTK